MKGMVVQKCCSVFFKFKAWFHRQGLVQLGCLCSFYEKKKKKDMHLEAKQ